MIATIQRFKDTALVDGRIIAPGDQVAWAQRLDAGESRQGGDRYALPRLSAVGSAQENAPTDLQRGFDRTSHSPASSIVMKGDSHQRMGGTADLRRPLPAAVGGGKNGAPIPNGPAAIKRLDADGAKHAIHPRGVLKRLPGLLAWWQVPFVRDGLQLSYFSLQAGVLRPEPWGTSQHAGDD